MAAVFPASQAIVLIHGSSSHIHSANKSRALEFASLEQLQRRALDAALEAKLPIVRIYEPGLDCLQHSERSGKSPSGSKGDSLRAEDTGDDLQPVSSLTAHWRAKDQFISAHDPSLPGELFPWASGVDFQLVTLALLASGAESRQGTLARA